MWKRYFRTQQGADYVEFAKARNKAARKATRRAVRSQKKIAKEAKQNPEVLLEICKYKDEDENGVAELVKGNDQGNV